MEEEKKIEEKKNKNIFKKIYTQLLFLILLPFKLLYCIGLGLNKAGIITWLFLVSLLLACGAYGYHVILNHINLEHVLFRVIGLNIRVATVFGIAIALVIILGYAIELNAKQMQKFKKG